jgi:hypothetical protein
MTTMPTISLPYSTLHVVIRDPEAAQALLRQLQDHPDVVSIQQSGGAGTFSGDYRVSIVSGNRPFLDGLKVMLTTGPFDRVVRKLVLQDSPEEST